MNVIIIGNNYVVIKPSKEIDIYHYGLMKETSKFGFQSKIRNNIAWYKIPLICLLRPNVSKHIINITLQFLEFVYL
jgi:hypothetical protein